MSSELNKPIPITVQEEKQLREVFDRLSDFYEKRQVDLEIEDLTTWLADNRNRINAEISAGLSVDDTRQQNTLARIEDLRRQKEFLENKPEKKISCNDVLEKMKLLNQKVTRKDVEEMIWEVDENLDGCLDWTEIRLMFNRNILDRTGLEPSSMFNLIQFLIYDQNSDGNVSVDETMNLLYARYGRSTMETKLKELFGEDMQEFGREGGEINFTNYLKSVEKGQMNLFTSTNKGQIAISKGFGKTKKSSDH